MDSLPQIEAAADGQADAALAQPLHEFAQHQILIRPQTLLRDRPEHTIAGRLIGMPVPMVSRES
jgi:hypothetical protein